MNKEKLVKMIFDFFEKLVISWLASEGKVEPKEPPSPPKSPEPAPPESPDEEVPETPKNPKPDTGHSQPNRLLYVPRDKRQDWKDRITFAYSVWRGEREYAAILNPEYRNIAKEYLGDITLTDIRNRMKKAQESHAKGERLKWRIDNEIHRKFRDRSQVRKSRVNEMRDELNERTQEYGEVAQKFPQIAGCDSIRCKLKKLKEREE